ncbi:hypothetical protein [Rhizobium changzhiense]|nr:hypothetical protein [Rhizobium changzhiense]
MAWLGSQIWSRKDIFRRRSMTSCHDPSWTPPSLVLVGQAVDGKIVVEIA